MTFKSWFDNVGGMNNNVTRLSHVDGVALSQTGIMQGWAKSTRSGKLVQSYLMPDGSWLEHWYAGALGDQWFLHAVDFPTAAPRHQIVLRAEW